MGRGFESLRAHYLLYKVGIAVLHGSLYARNVYNVVFPMEIFHMVGIAQLVSAPACGSGGQGFESPVSHSYYRNKGSESSRSFLFVVRLAAHVSNG